MERHRNGAKRTGKSQDYDRKEIAYGLGLNRRQELSPVAGAGPLTCADGSAKLFDLPR